MRKFKKVISIASASLMVLMMAGCGSASDKLSKAIDKTSSVKSYSFNAKCKIGTNQPVTKDEKDISQAIQNMNFSMNGKVLQEKNKYSKMDMNMKYDMMGMAIDFNVISDVNLKDNGEYKIFVKLPAALKAQAGEALAKYDYMYIGKDSMDKIQKEADGAKQAMSQEQLKNVTSEVTKFQDGFNKFIKGYTDENGKDIIKDQGEKNIEVNGVNEKLNMYQIKIDDQGLKKFLKSYTSDEKRKKDLEGILKNIVPTDKNGKNDIQNQLKNIDKMPKLLGDKGAILEFGVKDGYVVKEKINVDLMVEQSSINYSFDIDMFNIDKGVKIEMPKKDNKVIDLYDLIKQSTNIQK